MKRCLFAAAVMSIMLNGCGSSAEDMGNQLAELTSLSDTSISEATQSETSESQTTASEITAVTTTTAAETTTAVISSTELLTGYEQEFQEPSQEYNDEEYVQVPQEEIIEEPVEEIPPEPIVKEYLGVPEGIPKDSSYFDTCAFVGDSITTGFSGYGFVPEGRVFAAIGIRTDTISYKPIDTVYGNVLAIDALKQCMPENVYIMLGSNGLGWLSNDSMAECYSAFIDEVRVALPYSKIYILSVPPVSSKRENILSVSDGRVLNSEVDDYNYRLYNISVEKGLYYVDINTYLKDDYGRLPYDSSSDGMHFDVSTYQKVIDYILAHTVD